MSVLQVPNVKSHLEWCNVVTVRSKYIKIISMQRSYVDSRLDDHHELVTSYDARMFVCLLHAMCQRGHGSSITVEMEARSILSWGRSAPWGAFDERKKFLWGRSRKMQHREIEGMILMIMIEADCCSTFTLLQKKFC